VLEDTAKYIHDIDVAKGKKGAVDKNVTEKVGKDTISTRSTTVKQKTSKGPCRLHAAWVAGTSKDECPYKNDCIFEHVPLVPASVERTKVPRGKKPVKTP
jgi:hypothetical protein